MKFIVPTFGFWTRLRLLFVPMKIIRVEAEKAEIHMKTTKKGVIYVYDIKEL